MSSMIIIVFKWATVHLNNSLDSPNNTNSSNQRLSNNLLVLKTSKQNEVNQRSARIHRRVLAIRARDFLVKELSNHYKDET